MFEAVSAEKQTAIKATINVTDDLLQQLQQRHLLTLEDVILSLFSLQVEPAPHLLSP